MPEELIAGEFDRYRIEEDCSLGMNLGLFAGFSEGFVVENEAVTDRAEGPAKDEGSEGEAKEGGLEEQEDEWDGKQVLW